MTVRALELLLVAAAVVALAGPHFEERFESVSEDGIDLALVLDISASMQAADLQPNRLAALKRLAIDLVRGSSGNRIGVFVFAGHVFTHTPLTTDRETRIELIDQLSYGSINHSQSGGTAIGDALLVASDALGRQRVEGRDQLVVLFTDGESHLGIDPLLAARALREQEIAFQLIGIGRTDPVKVFVDGEPFINSEGEQLETRLEEEQLEAIAASAEGSYRHADSLTLLEEVFADLEALTRSPLEVTRVVVERSLVPAVAAVLLVLFLSWLWLDLRQLRSPLR